MMGKLWLHILNADKHKVTIVVGLKSRNAMNFSVQKCQYDALLTPIACLDQSKEEKTSRKILVIADEFQWRMLHTGL